MLGRLITISQGLTSRWRNFWFRLLGMKLGGYVWMRDINVPRNWQAIEVGKGAALDRGVQLLATGDGSAKRLKIGEETYINRFTTLDAHEDLKIGRDCLIGPYCYLTDADHQCDAGKPPKDQPMKASFLRIEDEVWIGSHVVILPGVTIGKGAVIGAGSVVTGDIPANAIAYGSPARVQGERS